MVLVNGLTMYNRCMLNKCRQKRAIEPMTVTDRLIGTQLGHYKIVDILGRGGMARLYLRVRCQAGTLRGGQNHRRAPGDF